MSFDELKKEFEECFEQYWDGYDADPISENALKCAWYFVSSMGCLSSSCDPEIIPETNGEVTSLYEKENLVFSISFDTFGNFNAFYMDKRNKNISKYGFVIAKGNLAKKLYTMQDKEMLGLYRVINAFLDETELQPGLNPMEE
jgi:hypothetical protein